LLNQRNALGCLSAHRKGPDHMRSSLPSLIGIAVLAVGAIGCNSSSGSGASDGGSGGPDGESAGAGDATFAADTAGRSDGMGDGGDTGASQDTAGAGDGLAADGGSEAGGGGGVVSVSGVCTADGRWCLVDPYPMGGSLDSIWGSSTSNLWMTGELGVLHYDGSNWTRYFLQTDSLFGTSDTDVWGTFHAAGNALTNGAPNLLHWDGSQWRTITTGTAFNLWSVWASSPTDVFAAGAGGTIMHFDGKTWTKQPSGTANDLGGLWGFGPHDVWLQSGSGFMLHYDGSQWSSKSTGLPSGFSGQLWGLSPTDLWACGGPPAYRWNGSSWSVFALGPLSGGISGCFGRAPNDIIFDTGLNSFWWWTGAADGGGVPANVPATSGQLSTGQYQIWAVGGEYVVGGDPRPGGNGLAHGSPGAWTMYTTGTGSGWGSLIWNAGGGTYYSIQNPGPVPGTNATPPSLVVSTAPRQWTAKGGIGTDKAMNAIWGTGPSDVWAVGDGGIATHYDGMAWTAQALQPTPLTDVWGIAPNDFWTTGATSYHWNGQQWAATGPGGAVVSGTASNDVWLGGGSSTSHWDGNTWSTYNLDLVVSNNVVVRLNAFAPNDAWLVTALGDVFHWNGSTWLGKASAYCLYPLTDAGTCGSPPIPLTGSGAHGFIWAASGDGWGPGMWHTTGKNAGPDTATTSTPIAITNPRSPFGGPGNAWADSPGLWKLQ